MNGPCRCCGGTIGGRPARGLCSACWDRHDVRGTLDLYPRVTRPAAHVLEDWAVVRRRRPLATIAELAVQLGMTHAALDRALVRARARDRARVSA